MTNKNKYNNTKPTTSSRRNIQYKTKKNTTRISFINVNGIYANHNDKIMEVSSQMMEHKIDIFGLSETNTHWNNGNIYRKALNTIKKTMKNTKAHLYTSDSTIEWKSRYKPGGTAIITNGQITNQIKQIENDSPLGRWTSITIGPPTFEITIITAYIVCHTQITPNNDKTATHQQ